MMMISLSKFMLFVVVSIIGRVNIAVSGANSFSRDDFPPGFVFGAGSSAYEAEGAVDIDGRTPSIWDTFANAGNLSADVASDEYHKYKEDVQLMVDTGLEAYRFSISWSRLIPNGSGPVNQKGLQYYNNLINELVNHGIQPHVTLHHCDFPQALETKYGGWVSREMVKDFTAYANVCFREFGDRVKYWTTLNEPNVCAIGGYNIGFMPPGRCSPPFGTNCVKGNSSTEPYIVVHHQLLAHATVARLYEKSYKENQKGFIGINVYHYGLVPLTKSTEDEFATQRANDFYLGWILNPLVFGDYPEIMKKNAGSRMPTFTSLESETIKGSFDFLGLNFYNTVYVMDQSNSIKEGVDFFSDLAVDLIPLEDEDKPAYQYPIKPWAMVGILEYIKEHYGNPVIHIQENGQKTKKNSSLEDWSRVKFMNAYIGSLLDAIRNGSNVGAYFMWSFMDLFQLFDGYDLSFGLYYVDLEDQDLRRIPKLSAHWYKYFLNRNQIQYL